MYLNGQVYQKLLFTYFSNFHRSQFCSVALLPCVIQLNLNLFCLQAFYSYEFFVLLFQFINYQEKKKTGLMAATYLCSGYHVFICWSLPTDRGLFIVIPVFTRDLHLESPSIHTNMETVLSLPFSLLLQNLDWMLFCVCQTCNFLWLF